MPVLANAPSASATVSSQNAALRTATRYATPLCGVDVPADDAPSGNSPRSSGWRRTTSAWSGNATSKLHGGQDRERLAPAEARDQQPGDRIRDRRRERAHEAQRGERLRSPPLEPVRDDRHRDGIERQRRAQPDPERPQQIERGEAVHVRQRQQRQAVDQRARREQEPRAGAIDDRARARARRAPRRARRRCTRARSMRGPSRTRARADRPAARTDTGSCRTTGSSSRRARRRSSSRRRSPVGRSGRRGARAPGRYTTSAS